MRTYAWTLRYRYNGMLMRIKTDHPIKTILFSKKRDAEAYRDSLAFKDTIYVDRVEVSIELKPSLKNPYC